MSTEVSSTLNVMDQKGNAGLFSCQQTQRLHMNITTTSMLGWSGGLATKPTFADADKRGGEELPICGMRKKIKFPRRAMWNILASLMACALVLGVVSAAAEANQPLDALAMEAEA